MRALATLFFDFRNVPPLLRWCGCHDRLPSWTISGAGRFRRSLEERGALLWRVDWPGISCSAMRQSGALQGRCDPSIGRPATADASQKRIWRRLLIAGCSLIQIKAVAAHFNHSLITGYRRGAAGPVPEDRFQGPRFQRTGSGGPVRQDGFQRTGSTSRASDVSAGRAAVKADSRSRFPERFSAGQAGRFRRRCRSAYR